MQNDLISRSALIARFKQLQGADTLANMFVSDVIKEVKNQPTAYSVESVVAELEKRRSIHNELSQSDKLTDEEKLIQTRFDGCFTRAIAIVRNGGKE